MYQEHPCFEDPDAEEAKLWRYMDFVKFVAMLESGSLFFARADLFEDPWEGSWYALECYAKPFGGFDIRKVMRAVLARDAEAEKTRHAVSCWHLSEVESAALWRLYAQSQGGIAIQTTFARVKESLADYREAVFIGKVKYIDYDRDQIKGSNAFLPLLHKRRSFEHEREVRAITLCCLAPKEFASRQGISVPVVLDKLIETVHVCPWSPEWVGELTKRVVQRYGLKTPVQQSKLLDRPPC
ncbi:MAG TPA: hypothetical protein VM098_00615 [Phycisphaerae bacterium]|nr:hypothetical protein [Phycisphaerae bacterium]